MAHHRGVAVLAALVIAAVLVIVWLRARAKWRLSMRDRQNHEHPTSASGVLDFSKAAPQLTSFNEQHRRLDDQVRDELRHRAAEIVQAFLGDPNPALSKWNSQQWRWGRKGSFVLNVTGPKEGLWFDHEHEVGGDIIDFLEHQLSCSTADAIGYALDYLGPAPPQPDCAAKRQRESEQDDAARIRRALRVWSEVAPLRGTLAEAYLAGRGITMPDEAPNVLGFHRHCPFLNEDGTIRRAPALIALVEDVITSESLAIHRRELTLDGDKIGSAKALGPTAGGAIKFIEPSDGELTIGEGIETCLSGMQLGYGPTWSTINAGGIGDFPVLDHIRRLTILVDNDESGTGQRAAAACRERYLAAGKSVRLVMPDIVGHDINDILLASLQHA